MKSALPLSKVVFAVGFAALLIGLSHSVRSLAFEPASCPDRAAGEQAEDCPWAGVARTLISEAQAGRPVAPAMQSLLPKLFSQIKADGLKNDAKDLWGQSINFDEIAKDVVVHPAILAALAQTFGVPTPAPGARIMHAGMEHTYGYLFSVLKTPYGYKRARWVQGEIEEGFNLPKGLLGPTPAEGSLFTNITTFIGNIAFRTAPNEMAVLRKLSREAAPGIRHVNYSKMKPIRLEERVEVPNANGKIRTVKLLTDFVPFFTQKNPAGNTHLLIYSVIDPFHHEAQVISAFPVETSFVKQALNPQGLGKNRPIMTRYNGFVEGLSGQTINGERWVVKTPEVPQL